MAYKDAEQRREAARRWAAEHPDAMRAAQQKYQQGHAEEVRARKRAAYAANRERILAERKERNALPEAQQQAAQYYQENRERILAREKARRETDPEPLRERNRAWYAANRETKLRIDAAWRAANRDSIAAKTKARSRALRVEVLSHYSDGAMACACCGEHRYEFLTLDHVNGGGAAHRREVGSSRMFSWLKSQGYPSGFRVLCSNCNWSLGVHGYCPHTDERKSQQ